MGTTGYVRVVQNGKLTAVFETQFDGFTDQLGRQLVYGLQGKRVVRGYDPSEPITNLVGDLALEVARITLSWSPPRKLTNAGGRPWGGHLRLYGL